MYAGVKLLPERVISLPGDPEIASAIFTGDGTGVFILTRYSSLHVGEFLDATLPAWLAVFCVIFFVWGIVRIVRAIRRKREPGKRYCPRCNYCVTHDSGVLAVCSECGTDLTKRAPVEGQSTLRRVMMAMGTMVVPAVAVYGVGVVLALTVGLFAHLDWRSAWLGEKLDSRRMSGNWWGLGLGFSQTLYRADVATGTLTQLGDYEGTTFRTLTLHPQTGDLYLETGHSYISLVDANTGIIKSQLELDDYPRVPHDAPVTLDHDVTKRKAFTHWAPWTRTGQYTILGLWNLDSQAAQTLARIESSEGLPTNTHPRQFVTKGDDTRRVVLAIPTMLEIFNFKQFIAHTFAQKPGEATYTKTHEINLGTDIESSHMGMISLRHDALIVTVDNRSASTSSAKSRASLRAYDLSALERGENVVSWEIPLATLPYEGVAMSPDESTMYVRTDGGVGEIDIEKRGMQRLLSPDSENSYARAVAASASHVLATYTRGVGPPDAQGSHNQFTADIYIWRLR